MASAADRPALAVPEVSSARAFWTRVRGEIAADRVIYLFAGLYALAALLLALTSPAGPRVSFFVYLPVWIRGGAALVFGFVLVSSLPATVSERPDRPLLVVFSYATARLTPRFVAGLLLILLQAVLMGIFTSVKTMLPEFVPFGWDTTLANIARFIFGHGPWRYLTPVIADLGLLGFVEFIYAVGWLLALAVVPAVVALAPSFAPIRVRFFLTYILCWALLGNVLAAIGMSAGPVYYGEVTGNFDRFHNLVNLLSASSGSNWSAYDIQRSLWNIHADKGNALGSGISAFPSLHVAMATLWAITGFQRCRAWGLAGTIFATVVLLGSVILGWHYAIDGLASIVFTLFIWRMVGQFLARRRRTEGAERNGEPRSHPAAALGHVE